MITVDRRQLGTRLVNTLVAVALAASFALLGITGRATAQSADWWIVLATTSEISDPPQMDRDVARIRNKAAPCGIEWFNDFSGKFRGFAEGYMVFVIGPFKSKAAASKKTASARPCFRDLYLKRATYLGE